MIDYRRILRIRFGRSRALERELDEEIRTHIELRAEELIAGGMTPEDARAEAERRFGDPEAARRALYASARRRERRLSWGRWLDECRRDITLAARRMRRAPGYAGVSVSILGLGIALTTVMFALVDAVLVRPLPFPDADRLVSLQSVGSAGTPYQSVSMANWYDWREQGTSLAATGIMRQSRLSVGVGGRALRATGTSVGGDFFDTVRPELVAGRALAMEDGQAVRLVAMLSEGFATRHFGSAEAAVGRSLTISGRPYEVVGVVADGQAFPEGTDLWVQFFVGPGSGSSRNNINFRAVARLAPGATIERADTELDAVARGIRQTDPDGAFHAQGVGVLPLQDVIVAEAAPTLTLLMASVVIVLLLACANLAGLGLARARSRSAEVSLRLALGSGRGSIFRQILVEHLGLALLGAVAGLTLASLAGSVIFDRLAVELPRVEEVRLDPRVVGFSLFLSVAAGLAAGLLPALRVSGLSPVGRAQTAVGRRVVRGGRGLPGGLLVSAEVALALTVLVGGGLLFRSLQAVSSRDLGYDPDDVLVAEIDLNGDAYWSGELAIDYWRVLLNDLSQLDVVHSASVANSIPTSPGGTGFLSFPHDPEPDFGGGYRVVSDRYFETLDITLLSGRTFGALDERDTERVALVNRAMAERAWPDDDPLGQRLAVPSMEGHTEDGAVRWLRVVGVVENLRHGGYESESQPEVYTLYRQLPRWSRGMYLVVRAAGGARAELARVVGETLRSSEAAPAFDVEWLDERVDLRLRERVLTQRILAGFGATALLLMSLGIYGLVAHAAAQRTREMAVRTALGAGRSGILTLMLAGAGRVIAVGMLMGLFGARALTGVLDSLLVDVPATDGVTFGAAALLLIVIGLLAALAPSVRASRLDPLEALRGD